MPETTFARTTLSIDGKTFRALADLARKNERSVSGEARVAIRKHLESAPAADKLVAAGAARDGAA
jgi:hypothetical protein